MADQVPPTSLEDILGTIGGSSGQGGGPQVWLGDYSPEATGPLSDVAAYRRQQTGLGQPDRKIRMSVDQAIASYYSLSPRNKQALIDASIKLGMSPDKINDQALLSVWSNYVKAAQGYQSKGKDITPWTIMLLDITSQENAKQSGAGQKGPTTTTQTSTNLSTQLDAKGILYTASRSLLGRDPTDEESNRFWQTLNAQERANPTTTTTTTSYGPEGEATNQQQTVSGGLGSEARQMLSVEEAKKNPEYGAYQAATTYYNAFMQKLSGG